jgi:hypothetical protein
MSGAHNHSVKYIEFVRSHRERNFVERRLSSRSCIITNKLQIESESRLLRMQPQVIDSRIGGERVSGRGEYRQPSPSLIHLLSVEFLQQPFSGALLS